MIYKLLQLISLGVLISRLRHGRSIRAAQAKPNPGMVSVIIPARDEELRIASCLIGLEEVHEVIVVDDCSSDATADTASRLEAKVVSGAPLPKGWVGKPWAMQQGLEAATGDHVVFLDADTIPQPGLVGALVEELTNNDVVSFTARFRCDSAVESALHASFLTTLVYRFGPPGSPSSADRIIANGQCMAFRRDWLIEQGGFKTNRSNMTDDVALVRELSERGARIAFVDGGELLDVDMHDSVSDVWNEWGRSLPMPDATKPKHQVADVAFIWITLALPWLRLYVGRANAFDFALLGIRSLLSFALVSSYRRHHAGVLLSGPLGVVTAFRFTQATLRPVRTWKGRTYASEDR